MCPKEGTEGDRGNWWATSDRRGPKIDALLVKLLSCPPPFFTGTAHWKAHGTRVDWSNSKVVYPQNVFFKRDFGSTLWISQIETQLVSAGDPEHFLACPNPPPRQPGKPPGLECSWKTPGEDQHWIGLPTREAWPSTRSEGPVGEGAGGPVTSSHYKVEFAVLTFHQRVLTKLFFFYLCRSLPWDENMAASFAACVCCVWFPWFVFWLWKRNRSWLRDGKQTTVCQQGHSSCPPEGAVNSRSLVLCQHADHPGCGTQKATRQCWAWGSATQLAWGLSQLPAAPRGHRSEISQCNGPWRLHPTWRSRSAVGWIWGGPRVNVQEGPEWAEPLRPATEQSPVRKSLYCSVKSCLAMFKLNSFVFYCSAES